MVLHTTKPVRVSTRDGSRGRPTLVILHEQAASVFTLTAESVTIGRDPACTISLDVEGLSRRHAKFARASDGVVHVVDLDSTNGTFVHGQRISLQVLRGGDEIQLGPSVRCRLHYVDPDAASVLGLTARQLEVACRVARGETSADIAEALGLSVRTVSSHLDRIYARLGIGGRVELAQKVHEAGLV